MSRPTAVTTCMLRSPNTEIAPTATTSMALTCRWRSRPQHQKRKRPTSFDHLVCAGQYRLRDRKAQCPCGFQIDHKLECRGLLDREVPRLRALDDLVDVDRRPAAQVEPIRVVGD